MRKKRRVPVVLWRLFGERARTLSATITSLIGESGGNNDATSLLLQPHDPSDYVKLLNNCFVVLDRGAPRLVAGKSRPHNKWSQHEIVVRTIEMMMRDKSTASNNVLSCAYDKFNHSSPVIELLTSSSWSLLLKRIGDDTMVYVLRHTSIFLPFLPKKYFQVSGHPVNSLALKFMINTADPGDQDHSIKHFGHKRKRNGTDDANSLLYTPQQNHLSPKGSVGCVSHNDSYSKPSGRHPRNINGYIDISQAPLPTNQSVSLEHKVHLHDELVNVRTHSRRFRWQRCKKRRHLDIAEGIGKPVPPTTSLPDPANDCQMDVPEAASLTTGASTVNYEEFLIENLQDLNQVIEKKKPKRHSRQFRWQRHKKHRRLDVEEASDEASYSMHLIDGDAKCLQLQYDSKSHFNDKGSRKCNCCLVFQDAYLVTKGAQVNRQPIFYNLGRSSMVLPRNHLLNSLKPNLSGSVSLLGIIFGLSNINANAPSALCSHSNGSTCLYHLLVKLLKSFIRRTRFCKHLQLLDKHCAVPTLIQGKDSAGVVPKKVHNVSSEHCSRTLAPEDSQTEVIKSYCSKNQVVAFIWAVCRSLVPPDMLGTPINWRILRRNISKFIQLRRYEKFTIRQCMHRLKKSGFPFLSDKHVLCCSGATVLNNVPKGPCKLSEAANTLKHILLEKWILWLFSCLVVPVLQANFYITESEHGKQDVFYYRKPIWEMLKTTTIAGLKDQNYQHLDPGEARRIIGNRVFGFSKLRLRPKENGARMLANLRAPSRMPFKESSFTGIPGKAQIFFKSTKYKHFKPVNYVLRDSYAVLKGILSKEPEKLGSSVFDYNDIYRKLCLFIIGLKNGSSTIPTVYIVVSDVSKAFDSVDQDQLLTIMKDILHEDQYLLQQSSQVVCTKKSFWVNENLTLADSVSRTGFAKKSSARFGSADTVLVNQGLIRCMKRKDILLNLYEHVKRNVLQLDKTFYLQGIGIPQGSILSSLLCSVYYGHLENHVLFPLIEKTREPSTEDLSRKRQYQESSAAAYYGEDGVASSPSHILLRLIDDLCFISTSKKQAENIYIRLRGGFREYNCYMNEEKFCLNFHSGHDLALPLSRVYIGEDGISFIRWSGLLLNSCSLEVQADYTRYLKTHLRSTLTISWQGKPGRHLKGKLCAFMRPKCHPIFFDSNINTGPVVRLNIYQAFLLCAMKFHCYVSEMYICKLHPRFHLKVIKRSFRYMFVHIKKMMHTIHTGSHFYPILQLEAGEVEWLGLNAFIKVLKRKQSRHKKLLHLLESKLLAHRISENVSSQLKYAVGSSHSSVMWKIKY